MNVRQFQGADQQDLIALWHACELVEPQNDPAADIAAKLRFQPELLFVAFDGDRLIGSVMVGYDGHRGWINYLAVDPGYQLGGVGRALMNHAEESLVALGCPKVNLQVRSTNSKVIEFYHRLGYEIEERTNFGKRLN